MRLPPASDMKPPALKDLRVLVVDDNAATVRLIADVLRASGVGKVVTARSGAEALSMLAAVRPNILFVDWLMPHMDGVELTRLIRRAAIAPDPRIPDPTTPIIMLSARPRSRDVEMARLAGVSEFVVKPFTPAALLSRIELTLTKPRPFVAAEGYIGPDRRRRRGGYGGPLRRAADPQAVVDDVERDLARRTMSVEISALKVLIAARGGLDRQTMRMCYLSMQHNVHRAQAVRDVAIEQAAKALVRYIDAAGGAAKADPATVQAHMDALSKLLETSPVAAAAAAANLA